MAGRSAGRAFSTNQRASAAVGCGKARGGGRGFGVVSEVHAPVEIVALVKSALLPESYEAAKRALAECERLDECGGWADKAAAIASYARQADNWELEAYAQRIRLRAVRRMGELLKTYDARGGDRVGKVATPLAFARESRRAVAEEAGLSEHKTRTALKIASLPSEEFEAAVESNKPPGTTTLAQWINHKQSAAATETVIDCAYPKGTAALWQHFDGSWRRPAKDRVRSETRQAFEERHTESLKRLGAADALEALLRFERNADGCGVELIAKVLLEQRGSQKLERVRRAIGLVFRLNSALDEAGGRGNPMLRSMDEKEAS
jgi:hypothetical protein